MMKYIAMFQKELVSLGLTLIAAFILWLFRSRPRLIWGMTHGFTFNIRPVPPPPSPPAPPPPPAQPNLPAPQNFLLHTATLVLGNGGRSAANNVEVTFNWRPDNFEI